ncbi:hypothetical protein BC936DRAFT_147282, partial [Jimgerdemannia flammicorona]
MVTEYRDQRFGGALYGVFFGKNKFGQDFHQRRTPPKLTDKILSGFVLPVSNPSPYFHSLSLKKHLRASAISLETVNSALGPMTLSATTSLSAKTVCGAIEIQQRPDWQHGSTTSSVRLETVSGSIQGRFVAGQHFTVKTVSGSVDVAVDAPESGSRPSVDLQTVSGIVNGRVSIGKQLKLSSVSGPVELQLDSGNEAPEVKGSTVSGDLTIDF